MNFKCCKSVLFIGGFRRCLEFISLVHTSNFVNKNNLMISSLVL